MVTALCGEGIDLSQCLGKQAEEPAGGEETSELTAIDEGGEDCTQKKISQRWLIPKQTVNMILKDFENKKLVELFPMQGEGKDTNDTNA